MAASPKLLALLGLVAGLSACKNECQLLCEDMAEFAESCDQEWDKEQVKSCRDTYKNSNLDDGEVETCEEVRPFLQEEWTCDEISDYFDAGTGGTGGTDGTDGTGGTESIDSGM